MKTLMLKLFPGFAFTLALLVVCSFLAHAQNKPAAETPAQAHANFRQDRESFGRPGPLARTGEASSRREVGREFAGEARHEFRSAEGGYYPEGAAPVVYVSIPPYAANGVVYVQSYGQPEPIAYAPAWAGLRGCDVPPASLAQDCFGGIRVNPIPFEPARARRVVYIDR